MKDFVTHQLYALTFSLFTTVILLFYGAYPDSVFVLAYFGYLAMCIYAGVVSLIVRLDEQKEKKKIKRIENYGAWFSEEEENPYNSPKSD